VGSEGVGTLKLLREPLVNYSAKGAECKGVVVVTDKSMEFL
jgi:hypothetical protein